MINVIGSVEGIRIVCTECSNSKLMSRQRGRYHAPDSVLLPDLINAAALWTKEHGCKGQASEAPTATAPDPRRVLHQLWARGVAGSGGLVLPKSTDNVTLAPDGRAFRIVRAEPVDDIEYGAFTCDGIFIGTTFCPAPIGNPWPVVAMFSEFLWPRSAGGAFAFAGQVALALRVTNNSDRPQSFSIRLVGEALPEAPSTAASNPGPVGVASVAGVDDEKLDQLTGALEIGQLSRNAERLRELARRTRPDAGSQVSLAELQRVLPWRGRYSDEFDRGSPHRHFGHALHHVAKALGHLSELQDEVDHNGSEFVTLNASQFNRDYAKYVGDLVILAIRLSNEFPGGKLNLDGVVRARVEEKNGVRLGEQPLEYLTCDYCSGRIEAACAKCCGYGEVIRTGFGAFRAMTTVEAAARVQQKASGQ